MSPYPAINRAYVGCHYFELLRQRCSGNLTNKAIKLQKYNAKCTSSLFFKLKAKSKVASTYNVLAKEHKGTALRSFKMK